MLAAEAIRRALDLEVEKDELETKLRLLEADTFPEPKEPVYSFVPKTYPSIKVKTNWKLAFGPILSLAGIGWLLFVFGVLFNAIPFMDDIFSVFSSVVGFLTRLSFIWLLAYIVLINKRVKKSEREKIAASDEYQSQCKAIDRENEQAETQAKAEYEAAKQQYDEKVIAYEAEKSLWEQNRESEIKETSERLSRAVCELRDLYCEKAAIDSNLRNIASLNSICTFLDTGNNPEEAVEAARREQARRAAIQAEQRRQLAEQAEYERQMRAQERAEQHSGILASVFSNAVGTSVGTHAMKKELRKQTRIMEREQEDRRQRELAEDLRRMKEDRRRSREEEERRKEKFRREQEERLRRNRKR